MAAKTPWNRDPLETGQKDLDILVDRGLWIWADPLLLILGGVFLGWLGIFLFRKR